MRQRFLWSTGLLLTGIVLCVGLVGVIEKPMPNNTPMAFIPNNLLPTKKRVQKHKQENHESDNPEGFVQFQHDIRTKDGQSTPAYISNYRIKEMIKAGILSSDASSQTSRKLLKSFDALPWVERGPANVAGRTRGLIIDPDDATGNTWFTGSVSGGVWKTTNSGASWEAKAPNLPNLSATSLAMAASNHDVIYMGSGEAFTGNGKGDFYTYNSGDGIFKSTDHGETWFQLANTAGNSHFKYVNRVIVSPTDEDLVLACTTDGIYRSIDGGDNWDQVYSSSNSVQHIIANPLNFNTQYASVNGFGVVRSFDGGQTWASAKTGIGGVSRLELAITALDTNRVFAAAEVSNSTCDLYVSDDRASTWLLAKSTDGKNWLEAQGDYDNTIVVHPYSKDTVFVGGVVMLKIGLTPVIDTVLVRTADTIGTSSFLTFTNFGLGHLNGGMGTGFGGFGSTNPTNLAAADTTFDVEIRFGSGITQKAHRFMTQSKGAGQTTAQYSYLDYVDVPFQAWDITNNRQLMISFRDEKRDGAWDLSPSSIDSISSTFREYTFIHAVTYSSSVADPNIAVTGGIKYKEVCEFGPRPPTDTTPWNPNSLPNSKIIFTALKSTASRNRTNITVSNPYNFPPYNTKYGFINGNVHVDHHNLAVIPVDQATNSFKIVNTSDGGIAASTNSGKTWTIDQTTVIGYNTTQFYGVDKKTGAYEFIGGTQDNGTWKSPAGSTSTNTSSWTRELGGDGFDVAWNPVRTNEVLGTIYNNAIYKSTDNGTSWFDATSGLTDQDNLGPFVTQIGRSKQDPDLIFAAGASGVWRSDDFANTWKLSTVSTANWGFNGSIHFVKIGQKNPQIVWAGGRMSASGKIQVSIDGGLTFTATNNYTTATLGRLSGLATHPTEDSTAFALFSFANSPKVLRTTNLGQTWEDISGFGANSSSSNGFPNVAVYCLQVMPHNLNEIWVGTEIGLFISTDNGATWAFANNGLPPVSIWQLNIVDDDVVAATFGRGVWSVNIPDIPTLPVATLAPRINSSGQNPNGKVAVNVSLRSAYDSTSVIINQVKIATIGTNTVKDTALEVTTLISGNVPVQIVSYKNGNTYKSYAQTIQIIQANAPQTKYVNNFNSASSDFTGNGFSITAPSGFSNPAIHTAHPYSDNHELIYQLNVPVIVATGTSKLVFDEIALVEPGDPGTVFGDPNFWDYVIVEGTADGITWIPLENGWDARLQSVWVTAFNNNANGTPSLFRRHEINLLSKFSAGTPIFIRFRLFADEATNGWGWAIDNLNINGDQTSPSLVLGVLASPVVNVIRFAVGADESIISVALSVNSTSITLTKQGNLYFGNYTITTVGSLNTTVSATDSTLNPSSFSRSYTISQLSKSTSYHNYSFSGKGNGYILLGQSMALNVPPNLRLIGLPVDVAVTGSYADLKAEFSYDAGTVRIEYTDFDEAKIGLYQYTNGTWQYAGGMGDKGKVAAAVTSNQIAVFYNPDFDATPKDFALERNYPNPFNPTTNIRYSVPAENRVVIKVYNMLGQEVRTLVNDVKPAGKFEVAWDGRNNAGQSVASGVYIYRMEAGQFNKAQKMLFIK
ncbi:T9SS type A sorting domain-containing protein [bacterium]|nr:T9SS type A sorting domain-containing protein [bacterium]